MLEHERHVHASTAGTSTQIEDFAGPGHAMGWIFDFMAPDEFPEIAAATGAMLIGRRTHEVSNRMEAGKERGVSIARRNLPLLRALFVVTHRPSMRFGDVGLSAHLTRGGGIPGSQVTVAFAGGWGLYLTAHMADVEREIENKAREKARQAGKMPTIALVDISRAGWSWMRGPQAMIPALQKILPSTPFAGLRVFTTSLDNPEPMQTHLAIATRSSPKQQL